LVDEYQDTNHSQYLIVKALSDRFQNICVVGDDAQSIYAFRGANINNILNFQRDYDEVSVYRLEQNYRSTKNIVNAANSIIDKNKTKLEKVVWTANETGERIKINRSITDGDEGRFVASSIFENKMNLQLNNNRFAVLYRTNAQSRAIEDALRKKDIPYRIFGGLSFYQRKEIKDILAYLRLILNPNDEEALKRVINYPARGIGQTTIERILVSANHYNQSMFDVMEHIDRIEIKINSGTKAKLQDFVTMIRSFQILNEDYDTFQIAEHVTKKTGLLKELSKDGTPEGVARIENIEELLNGMKDFVEEQRELADATGSLTEFLEDVALATDQDKDKGDEDRVSLMTVHLAKGLEFPYVYIVGMEEDLFPNVMSLNTRSELEEERRLFYVAVTRAEKQAYLTYSQTRYRWGKLLDAEPSRFIEEIDEEYLEYLTPKTENRFKTLLDPDIFETKTPPRRRHKSKKETFNQVRSNKPFESKLKKLKRIQPITQSNSSNFDPAKLNISEGSLVEHVRFGKGKVQKIEGKGADTKAEIEFENGGLKKLLLRFAKLNVLKS